MPAILTLEKLRKLAPGAKKEILQGLVRGQGALAAVGILKNRRRLCYFLAQAAHETAGFRTLREYGSARYFRRRYGHRRDLGNRNAEDGARYRGRGIFQLTGRYNYRKFGRRLGLDLENKPERAARPVISVKIAAAYWKGHGLNRLADRGKFKAVTRKINGGYHGLKDRQVYLRRALRLWSPSDFDHSLVSLPSARLPHASPKSQVLRRGMKGAPVRLLQKFLQQAGFDIRRDGIFGLETHTALTTFQKKAGLPLDGLAGSATLLALQSFLQARNVLKNRPVSGKGTGLSSSLPQPEKGFKNMMSWKNVLQSRAIWSSLVGLAALAMSAFGFTALAPDSQAQIVDAILKIVEAGGFIGGVVFRLLATDRLTFHGDDLK